MEEIAARTPCSKATLYAYFDSKETLFYDAVVQALDSKFHGLYAVLNDTTSPVEVVLTRFGEQFIHLVCSDDVRALRRLVMAARGDGASDLQRKCFNEGPKVALGVCAAFLESAHEHGFLRVCNAQLAGIQLRALLEAEWLDSLFYNQNSRPTKKQARQSAENAIQGFLAIYGNRQNRHIRHALSKTLLGVPPPDQP